MTDYQADIEQAAGAKTASAVNPKPVQPAQEPVAFTIVQSSRGEEGTPIFSERDYRDYNARNQLTTETAVCGADTTIRYYAYDKNGNNTTYTDDNQVLHHAILEYLNGTLTKTTDMGYDSLNRMTSFNDGTTSESYVLRGVASNRVSKTSNGVTTTYLYDNLINNINVVVGTRAIAEYENGTLARQYLYGNGKKMYIDEPLAMYRPSQSGLYFTRNNTYNIAALTDNTGTAVERYKYEAFGNRTIYAPDGITLRSVSSYGIHIGYKGRTHDNTGLIDSRWRTNDPNLGLFRERDPKGYRGGWNLYSYVLNNPVRRNDPMGLGDGNEVPVTPDPNAGANDLASQALQALIQQLIKQQTPPPPPPPPTPCCNNPPTITGGDKWLPPTGLVVSPVDGLSSLQFNLLDKLGLNPVENDEANADNYFSGYYPSYSGDDAFTNLNQQVEIDTFDNNGNPTKIYNYINVKCKDTPNACPAGQKCVPTWVGPNYNSYVCKCGNPNAKTADIPSATYKPPPPPPPTAPSEEF